LECGQNLEGATKIEDAKTKATINDLQMWSILQVCSAKKKRNNFVSKNQPLGKVCIRCKNKKQQSTTYNFSANFVAMMPQRKCTKTKTTINDL